MKILLSAFLGVFLLLSCTQKSQYPDSEKLAELGFRPIPDKPLVPDISFTDDNAEVKHLSDFRDHVILINFWASWCPPCRAEMPALGRMASALKGGDFIMIPINVGESRELVEAFAKEYEIDFPLYFDESSQAAAAMGVSVLPTTMLIDRKGAGVAVIEGVLEWDSKEIISLLEKWSR